MTVTTQNNDSLGLIWVRSNELVNERFGHMVKFIPAQLVLKPAHGGLSGKG